jgi:hypothetical protein
MFVNEFPNEFVDDALDVTCRGQDLGRMGGHISAVQTVFEYVRYVLVYDVCGSAPLKGM